MYEDEALELDIRIDRREAPGIPYRGAIWATVTALTDDLYVVLPEQDTEGQITDDTRPVHKVGPVLGWDKRSDASYPSAGDDALVFVDSQGDYWLSNWSPL